MFLGIDVSRHDVATVLMQPDGSVVLALRAPLAANSDSRQTWKLALDTAQETLIRSQIERAQIEGAACAIDATFNKNGVVQRGPLAEGWHDFDVPQALRETLKIQCTRAASRVWCETLGEERFGALRNNTQNALYLHVGSILGAVTSRAVASQPKSSTRDDVSSEVVPVEIVREEIAWGEIGIERDGVLGSSGRRGTLEAYCTVDNFLLRASSYGLTLQSAEEIWAQSATNFAARAVCDDYVRRLAQGIGSAVSLLNAQKIVLGGSLPNALSVTLFVPLRTMLREFCAADDVVLSGAQLSHDGAVLGACALAMQENTSP